MRVIEFCEMTYQMNVTTTPSVSHLWAIDKVHELHGGSDAAPQPEAILDQAFAVASRPLVTTNFRPGSAALLHLLVSQRPDLPVIWIDSGYNTSATYHYVDYLTTRLSLNLHVYTPTWTAGRFAALGGPVPSPGDEHYDAFVELMKLEPFTRAFDDFAPDVWFTGIRRHQSVYRSTLGSVSRGHRGVLRVAPMYYWDDADVDAYLDRHAIANNTDYVDPTKPGDKLECGLQHLL